MKSKREATKNMGNETGIAIPERPEQGVAVYSPKAGGVLASDDAALPWLSLAQSQTAIDHLEEGRWYRKDLEQHVDDEGEIEVVPLAVQVTHTYWGPGGFDRSRKPLCFSTDGVTSEMASFDGTPTTYPGQECATCPKMPTDRFRQRPADDWCDRGHLVLLMDANTFEIYLMRLASTSNKFARPFTHNLREGVYRLGSVARTTDRGSWYQMVATRVRQLDEADQEMATAFYEEYGGTVQSAANVDGDDALAAQAPVAQAPVAPARPAAPAARFPKTVATDVERQRAADARQFKAKQDAEDVRQSKAKLDAELKAQAAAAVAPNTSPGDGEVDDVDLTTTNLPW